MKRSSLRLADEIAAECLVMRVRRLNREVSRLYDREAKKHGLTAGRANVLVAVAANPGVTAADMVEPLSMEKSTLSRNLARLEADGLIRVEEEGRLRRLLLTDEGAEKIEAIYPDWLRVQATARELLGGLAEPLLARG